MYARLALTGIFLILSPVFVIAQQPGQGARLWQELKTVYPSDHHYLVVFSYERRSPMTRSAPETAMMTYSNGMFVAVLPEITWYFNGDTLWEFVPATRELLISEKPEQDVLSPSEILEILTRIPVSVRHHGATPYNGEACDRLKLDFSGRNLPYETVYLWVNPEKELVKVIFLDQWQNSTTIAISSIKETLEPDSSEFRFSGKD